MNFFLLTFGLCVCAGQFINSPEPFNPLATFIVPTGTSASTFDGTLIPAPATITSTTSNNVVAPTVSKHDTPASKTWSTAVQHTSSSAHDLPISVTPPSTRTEIPSGVDVITVVDTFWTTVSCSTSSPAATTATAYFVDLWTSKRTAASLSAEMASTQSSLISRPYHSLGKPTSTFQESICQTPSRTVQSTLLKVTTETQDTTVTVTATSSVIVSV